MRRARGSGSGGTGRSFQRTDTLEHIFGHGKETLASILVVLNLLAFGFHTTVTVAVLAKRQAVVVRGATYRFFERLRTITACVVFRDWVHLLRSITAATIQTP